MELNRIVMDRNAARRAFLQYRNAFRKTWSAQDQQIMRGYRALAKGLQLIKLSEAIKAGGFVEHAFKNWDGSRQVALLPRIAVVQSSAKMCHCHVSADGSMQFQSLEYTRAESKKIKFAAETIPETIGNTKRRHIHAKAIVPLVPPQFRPPHSLDGYHTLFEAEWDVTPPKDPALLKHIGGDLYAVLAVWDLTEVERAVLALNV